MTREKYIIIAIVAADSYMAAFIDKKYFLHSTGSDVINKLEQFKAIYIEQIGKMVN